MKYSKNILTRITGITIADEHDEEQEKFKFWCMDNCPNAEVSVESTMHGNVIIDNSEDLEDGISILWEMYCSE
jgi:hypothetical protein